MDYKNYDTEHFIRDEEFKRWVKSPSQEDQEFWQHWLVCHPEKRGDVALARELIMSISHQNETPSDSDSEEVLHHILKAGNNENDRFFLWKYLEPKKGLLAVAAAIGLLLASIFLFGDFMVGEAADGISKTMLVKENPQGIKSQFKLPDGTHVWLNSGSRVVYPESFASGHRSVELHGEAFFDVVKDKSRPFQVKSGNVTTTALGTSFNIRQNGIAQKVKVSLATGKVKVDGFSEDNELRNTHYLAPGQELSFHEGQVPQLTEFNWEESYGWKDGIILFKNANRDDVVETLESWYGISIEIQGKTEVPWNVTARFKDQSLENIMENISFTVGFDFVLDGKKLLIKSGK
ncbi:MAG: FecR domain-containing protein [Cyclobacteriaceae bacterium]